MMLTRPTRALLITLTIVFTLVRCIIPGWVMLSYFWIIIPFYLIHIIGQIKLYRRPVLDKVGKCLLVVSSLLFVVVTLFQYDCDDKRCYYILETPLLLLMSHQIGYRDRCRVSL